ncbi:hypothetical protein FRB99_007795 [Tulasnella sp. 403]|nr:hypothetical protein FRB99_007795 [Tulasnella sp. 403]
MGVLHVVNDTILASGKQFEDYTPREIGVRDAMIIITLFGPVVAAFFCFGALPKWPARKTWYTFANVAGLWFLSIGLVGIALFFFPGRTTRQVFIIAILHGQIEVVMNMLLLGFNAHQALAVTWTWASVQYGLTLGIKSPLLLFCVVSTVGGVNDFLMVLSLGYGKQWGLALGAVFHLVSDLAPPYSPALFTSISAVTVFVGISDNFGVVPWNLSTFFGLWGHVFFTVGGIINAPRRVLAPATPEQETIEYDDPPANPLYAVKFTPKTIAILLAICFAASLTVTLLLAFVLPS